MNYKKLFIRYQGSVADFKAANLEATYNKSIVFIGNGEAVYTHGKYYGDVKAALTALQGTVDGLKYFSGIKAGDGSPVYTASKDGVITFTADDPALVSVKADSYGVHIGLATEFTDKVNDTASSLAGEVSRATEAENKIKTALGEKDAVADNSESASAFGRIKNLEEVVSELTGGSTSSVGSQINAAIEALDVDAKEGDYVSGISQVDGKIVAEMGTFNFDEAGAASAAQSAAEAYAKSYTDTEIKKVSDAASVLEGRVADNEDALATLNGSGDGSVKKQVADAIAGVVASAPDDFDTLKEVADWIASDTSGAAKMQADIAKLNGADTVDGSVAKQVKDAVAAEAVIARAAEKANADAIDAIEADYLKATDKTELSNAVASEKSRAEGIEAGLRTDVNAAAQAAANNKAAIEALHTAKVEGFITSIEQVNGKVTATAAQTIASEKITIVDSADHFTAEVSNVEQALAALADMWSWDYPDA